VDPTWRLVQGLGGSRRLGYPEVAQGFWRPQFYADPTLYFRLQQDRFLPGIRDGSVNWCQGYSEPGAGSDLANLKTKAELSADGSHYLVNGQKIWTTLAQIAHWIFCLTRTSSDGAKQEGITFLLIPMDDPGVEVRPIITLGGSHSVNEVYFTDVKVPVENRVGEEGKGWTYAKGLLAHERSGLAGIQNSVMGLEKAKRNAQKVRVGAGTLLDLSSFKNKVGRNSATHHRVKPGSGRGLCSALGRRGLRTRIRSWRHPILPRRPRDHDLRWRQRSPKRRHCKKCIGIELRINHGSCLHHRTRHAR